MNKNKIYVAPFCSTNFFCSNTGLKSYIKNEVTGEYFLLEDYSADIWKLIINGKDYYDIIKYADSENLSKQNADDFLISLKKELLISDKPFKENKLKEHSYINCDLNSRQKYAQFTKIMYGWFKKNKFLSNLTIETTYNCNEKCIHCYNKYNYENKKNFEIKFEDIKPVIDEAYKMGLFSVLLTGGETTLSKDFLEIAKYIREKRISLEIYTNGIIFYNNKKLLKELVNLYPAKVSLSLFSMKPEVHDKITGIEGSHKKTISVLKELSKYNMRTEIKCFLTKYNYLDFDEIAEFAKEINSTALFDAKFINIKENCNSEIELNDKQLYELFQKYIKYNLDSFKYGLKQAGMREPCKAGRTTLSICPDLKVKMCNLLNLQIGDLKKESIKDIWTERTKNCRELTKWRKVKIEDLKDCYKHDYCSFCNYCVGFSLNENNYLGKSNLLCKIAKINMDIYNKLYN